MPDPTDEDIEVIADMLVPRMTPQDVKVRVGQVRNMAGDPEIAHGAEDELHQDVLRAIVTLSETDGPAAPLLVTAGDLAREALKTSGIDFSRWYA